jgi:hypothetical protein
MAYGVSVPPKLKEADPVRAGEVSSVGRMLAAVVRANDADPVMFAIAPSTGALVVITKDAEPVPFTVEISGAEANAKLMLADPEPLTINCPIAFAKLILRPAVPVRAGGESSRGKAVASAKLMLRLAVPLAVTPPAIKPVPPIVAPAM